MRIRKNNLNSVFDNMWYKYKNTFSINKLSKKTYNFNYKRKQYGKQKTFHYNKIYKHLIYIYC